MISEDKKTTLGNECIKELDRCWTIAREKWGVDFSDTILIWSKHTTHTAGRAWYKERVIQLSKNLLWINQDRFVRETPGHEAAHIIAFRIFGERGHGRAWKFVIQVLKVSNNRRHQLKTGKTA